MSGQCRQVEETVAANKLELEGIITSIAAKKREEKSGLDMLKALTNKVEQLESNLDVLQDEREVLQAGIDKRVAHLVCITLELLANLDAPILRSGVSSTTPTPTQGLRNRVFF